MHRLTKDTLQIESVRPVKMWNLAKHYIQIREFDLTELNSLSERF